MQADSNFVKLPPSFWANIRTISQEVGYTHNSKKKGGAVGRASAVKVPTPQEVRTAFQKVNLNTTHLFDDKDQLTALGTQVFGYLEYRADALNRVVAPLFMVATEAEALFKKIRRKATRTTAAPMNKQSGTKKKPAYFTGIINMLIEDNLGGLPCNYNPQELTTVTRNREPFRTLSRRVDGAFPGPINPLAVWEIKEYYHTTTFGSRVADGVYESLLDGMELAELDAALRAVATHDPRPEHIRHYFMIDARNTWWTSGGRPYLCRVIDMLHMGYVDEVLFGREVETRLPQIVQGWVAEYRSRKGPAGG